MILICNSWWGSRSGLVWFLCFNGISTLFRLFNAKAILLEEQFWYYSTHSWEDKGVHTFPKGICQKVNIITRLEYELAYYNSAVHRFNHYTTRTPPLDLENGWLVGWLVGVYGISTFEGYLTPNPFLWKQFYFKQLSLA